MPFFLVLCLAMLLSCSNHRGRRSHAPPVTLWDCAATQELARDERGELVVLDSEQLMRRAITTSPVVDPMKGHTNLQGHVLLDVVVNEHGQVQCIRVVEGHPLAVSPTVAAVQSWTFAPYRVADTPKAVLGELKVAFKFEKAK
jgi:hypothetical protein